MNIAIVDCAKHARCKWPQVPTLQVEMCVWHCQKRVSACVTQVSPRHTVILVVVECAIDFRRLPEQAMHLKFELLAGRSELTGSWRCCGIEAVILKQLAICSDAAALHVQHSEPVGLTPRDVPESNLTYHAALVCPPVLI